jgi:hypothetical protein
MISQDLGQLSRYGWLGTSLGEVLRSLVFHPFAVISTAFLEMGGWLYLILLFLPLAFTPLVGGELLLPALADLAANSLSSNPMPRSVFAYHSIALIPVLVVAGIYGARRLSRLRRYSGSGLGRLAFVLTLVLTYFFSPIPVPGAVDIWKPSLHRLWPDSAVADIKELIPTGASLSAQANIAPHFTHRSTIRPFPKGIGEVECAVLHLDSPTERIEGDDPGILGSLAHHLQQSPAEFLYSVRELIESAEYGVEYENLPWLLFCRGVLTEEDERKALLQEVENLSRVWLWP